MRECCRQVEAEVVSKSKNKIHQTWGPPISRALYIARLRELHFARNADRHKKVKKSMDSTHVLFDMQPFPGSPLAFFVENLHKWRHVRAGLQKFKEYIQ